MASGEVKHMDELNLGDQVAVRISDGTIVYEDIYYFGHKDTTVIAEFFRVTLSSVRLKATMRHDFRQIELTAGHFVPILSDVKHLLFKATGGQEIVFKRAADVKIGDVMWASSENAHLRASTAAANLEPYVVTDISTTVKRGLFNPYTMSGNILVNGVLASSHSEWILDGLFDQLGLTRFLPAVYQGILSVFRAMYRLLGKESYIAAYTWVEMNTGLIQLLNAYQGGGLTSTIWVASAIGIYQILKLVHDEKRST